LATGLEPDRKAAVPVASPEALKLNITLLDRLRDAEGDYVALDELGTNLKRVQGELDELVSFGFLIERHPYRGAAYRGGAERLCPDQIEHELATRWIGRRIAVWNRVTSTNDVAARAAASASNDGLVVLAEEQTAGRGRRGRSWRAPPRSSILMSVVLFPPPHLAPEEPGAAFGCAWLTALGAVATAEVVAAWTGGDATIKWPNDVRVEGCKIAGILVERAPGPGWPAGLSASLAAEEPRRAAVIGIGLNANIAHTDIPPELNASATSLQIVRGEEPVDRSELARDLIRSLDHWYDTCRSGGAATLNGPWCARSEHIGRIVRVATPTSELVGRLVDLDLCFGVTLAIGQKPHPDSAPAPGARSCRIPLSDILVLEPVLRDRVVHDNER
jgi:BirA family biotin operon repressor/biotin-[acetyl-CoA-carboxylase] ligase